jgi:hypothetical protein
MPRQTSGAAARAPGTNVAQPAGMPSFLDRHRAAAGPATVLAVVASAALVAPAAHARRGAHGARGASPSPSGGITKLAGGGDRLWALGDRSVAAYDAAGRLLRRCPAFEAPLPERAPRPRIGGPDAEEALAAAGLPDDDDDGPDAEAALDDEGLLPARPRRPSGEPAPVPRDLAAAPDAAEAWIASSAGLFRIRDGGCARAALAGRSLDLVAAAEGEVAAADDELVWRLDTATGAVVVATGLTTRPHALAVAPGARLLVGDDDGLLEIAPGAAPARILDSPTDAIAVCDGVTLALASDGVYALAPDAGPARVADRPPARALACGPADELRFIAVGVGVWTSADGVTWLERRGAIGRSVSAAAAASERVWLAIDGQLVVLDESLPGDLRARATMRAVWTPPAARRPPPALPWPRLTLAFGARETALRGGWSVLVLLAFPLGRSATRAVDPGAASAVAAELAGRDAALAAEEASLALGAGGIDEEEEIAAWARALRQEREALR